MMTRFTAYDRASAVVNMNSMAEYTALTRTRRVLAAHQRFLRALASALVRTKAGSSATDSTLGVSAAAVAAGAALNATGQSPSIAVTHRAFMRTIAARSEVACLAYAGITAGDVLGRIPIGISGELATAADRAMAQSAPKVTGGGLQKDVWVALHGSIRAVLAAAKDLLSRPWVDVGLVAAAIAALSYLYFRRAGSEKDSALRKLQDDESSVFPTKDSEVPPGEELQNISSMVAAAAEASPPTDWTAERSQLLSHISELESANAALSHTSDDTIAAAQEYVSSLEAQTAFLSAERDTLASHARELASALEKTMVEARVLGEDCDQLKEMVENLEEENRVLLERLAMQSEAETTSPSLLSSQEAVSSMSSASSVVSVPAVSTSARLSHTDSDDWEHLSVGTPPPIA
ncbi:hypothetical protein BC832DRAFT_300676 [Gaertneriomyces semiglobifer]|nr:hypothetical protein BC832DRAFT_300676 [Gaertneriomyces semiglobifer]